MVAGAGRDLPPFSYKQQMEILCEKWLHLQGNALSSFFLLVMPAAVSGMCVRAPPSGLLNSILSGISFTFTER